MEEEANEAWGDAAVHCDFVVDDIADDALGHRARLAIEPHPQAVDDQRIDGTQLGRRRQQAKKEQQRVLRHVSKGRDPASDNELTAWLLARITLWERKGKLKRQALLQGRATMASHYLASTFVETVLIIGIK